MYLHFIKTNPFYHESFSLHQIDYSILLHNYHSPIIVIYLFICSASITSQLANNMLIFLKTRNTVLIKYILFMHAISYFHYFPSFRMSQSNWRGKRNIISGLQIWYLSPLRHQCFITIHNSHRQNFQCSDFCRSDDRGQGDK